jgi:hypothetical protein
MGFVAVSEFDDGLYRHGGFLRVGLLAAVVIVAATRTGGALAAILSRSFPVAVGRRSYGLYLYHWPIFVLGRELPLPLWKINLLCLLGTVAVTEVSYRWIETPVRRGGVGALMRMLRVPRPAAVVAFGCVTSAVVAMVIALTVPSDSAADGTDGTATMAAGGDAAADLAGAPEATGPGDAASAAGAGAGAGAPSPAGASAAPATAAGTAPALVVGDSIALGSADSLRHALGAGTTVDAKVGRQFSTAPGIVRAWASAHAGPVVVDLGANGTVAPDDVEAVIAAASGRRVVFVGVRVPRRWQDGNNEVLRDAAAAHPSVEFVDWAAIVGSNPGVLGPDGVHPGPRGRTLLANAVADAIHAP